jgi:hypothetical protein
MQPIAGVLSQANSCTQAPLDMFQHAFMCTTDQMNLVFPSSRDSNMEQWINIKFSVKIGKSVSEILAL